jgi:organic radical activating enzyme
MFTVDHIRYGFATNSSSSHSLAVWKDAGGDTDSRNEFYFGWDWFRLTSREAKRRYLAAQVYEQLNHRLGDSKSAAVLARDYVGVELPDDDREMVGVDHQSVWVLPKQWRGTLPDRDFVTALGAYLDRDDVVILGGNDNDDEPAGFNGGTASAVDLPLESGSTVARYDAAGGHWVLFDRARGNKIRFRFDSDKPAAARAEAPELVDVKITDYCPFDCNFCYQGSTPKGTHADFRYLESLAYALGNAKVFEVALGGGEPTFHPNFFEILERFAYYGVTPNFTTRNTDVRWWEKAVREKKIFDTIGGVAFSVNTPADIEAVEALRTNKDLFDWSARDRVSLQYIVGQDDTEEALRAILAAAKEKYFRLTLLGYKFTGRGAAFGQRSTPQWPDIVAEYKSARIGIDTVLAEAGRERLLALGLDGRCLAPADGSFSCYVDAVTQRMHRSSYHGDKGVSLRTSDTFLNVWKDVRIAPPPAPSVSPLV